MPFRYNLISFNNYIIDSKINVRKCTPPFAPLSSKTFATRSELRIVAYCFYRNKSIDCTFITLVPDLLEKISRYLADFIIVMGVISFTLAGYTHLITHMRNYGRTMVNSLQVLRIRYRSTLISLTRSDGVVPLKPVGFTCRFILTTSTWG